MKQGPNVKRLICHKMSLQMVPPGAGIAGAIAALREPGNIGKQAKEATAWVEAAIALVRNAPGNLLPDDEAFAGEILRQVEERLQKQRKEWSGK